MPMCVEPCKATPGQVGNDLDFDAQMNHDYTTGGSPWDTVGIPGRAEIISKGAGTHVLSDGLSQTSVGCDQGAQERIRAAESHGVEVADDLPVGGDDCRFGVGDALGRAVFLDQGA